MTITSVNSNYLRLEMPAAPKWSRAKEITETVLPVLTAAGLVALAVLVGMGTMGIGLLIGAGAIVAISAHNAYQRNRMRAVAISQLQRQLESTHERLESVTKEANEIRMDLHKKLEQRNLAQAKAKK